MTLSRILLWRHGQTEHNASGHWQGHLDSPLTERGREQARAATPALLAYEPHLVVASDLRRATDTAKILVEASGLPLRLDKRLRETDIGDWQGLTSVQVDAGYPGGIKTWQADPTWAPPGGESRVEVATRAHEVVNELDEEHDGTVLLCAHGGLITALTAQLLTMPVPIWPQLGGLSNCHWAVLGRRPGGDGRWRLLTYNAGA
ncbi:histidine phosphatase family protein [Kutzneria sp. NPDC052558]|uniref:histidine phosphatase family protein n=1 Tax=Kutzneria sp. NPDC052558 TaxID=3364121 RepID=UPI0037C6C773